MTWKIKKEMNWVLAVWLFGCGVKGPPLPPAEPPQLGRGHPTYKGAGESIVPQEPVLSEEDDEEENENLNKKRERE